MEQQLQAGGVKKTERGWAGHFIGANSCRFRRNTLLEYNDIKIVVSTVGLMESSKGGFTKIGHDRYFETMVFHSNLEDTRYYDIDVSKQISFESEWAISEIDADDKANIMHDAVVDEIAFKLLTGNKFETYE